MKLTVQSFDDFGEVRILRLAPSAPLPHRDAGHYAFLQFGDFPPRPYSIANPPQDDGLLEFHIRSTPFLGGSSLATNTLAIGDTVTFHGFEGNYAYYPDCDKPLVLIAGGTGLASLLAITRASLSHTPDRPIFLYVGGRKAADLYYDATLKALASDAPTLSYIPVLSEDKAEGIASGFVGDVALHHAPALADCRLYVAGSVDMVRDVTAKALAKGLSPDVVHSDLLRMSSP